jgi:hypothetical protein
LGNGAYAHAGDLRNTINDVNELKHSLLRLKFAVSDYLDLPAGKLVDCFSVFANGLTKFDTVLFYYSGHGMQIDGVNFVVSPEADTGSPDFMESLVSIQWLIGRLTQRDGTTLVFLDACRNNPLGEGLNAKLEHNAMQKGLARPKAVFTSPGLASFSEASDPAQGPIFIAFAAAPGAVAWEGEGEVSIFTEGLMSTIEAVDLPIHNVMLRIATYVKGQTEGRQEPWSTSSLSKPFYFSESSLVWFNANLIGFVAFLVMMGIHSIILWYGSADPSPGNAARRAPGVPEISSPWLIALSSGCLLISLVLFLVGIGRSYRSARGDIGQAEEGYWWSSLVGGFFGGIFAALPIAFPYWHAWAVDESVVQGSERLESLGVVLCQILLACIATGVILGPLSYALAMKARSRSTAGRYSFALASSGGVVGGVIAGLAIAPALTWYFVRLGRPPISPWILLPGSLFGTAFIVFSIIGYNVERFSYRRMIANAGAAMAGTVLATLVAGIVVLGLRAYVDLAIWELAVNSPDESARRVGPFVGLVVGAILGGAIGLAVAFVNCGFVVRFTASGARSQARPLDRGA